MPTEKNKALAGRAYDTINQRNLTALDDPATPDFVFHNASMTIQSPEGFKQFLTVYFTAFPDLQFTVEDLTAEGETVVVRHTARGTHQAVLMGIPPTGKQVTLSGIAILRFTNGICVEEWFNGETTRSAATTRCCSSDGIGRKPWT
jgi:predicted ester cyclase